MALLLAMVPAPEIGAQSDVILVNPVTLIVSEPSGQGAFTVTLASQPTDTVTVGLSTDAPLECAVSPTSLVLTTENWESGVTALVTAQDDAVIDGPQTCTVQTAAAVSTDATFDGENPEDVVVTVIDDDGPMDASIGDLVWFDEDGNGIRDVSESGISGVTVFLDYDYDTSLDPGEPSDTTDATGAYDITGLAAGTYPVRVDDTTLPSGYNLTTANIPHTVALADSQDYNDADFGYEGYTLNITLIGSGSVTRVPDQP
ncbi:MAG: hypothetical protein GWN58_10840, partial [Anaerolineae bacterium]|nr:hypothetical protein [Anaerolineae bacterium]